MDNLTLAQKRFYRAENTGLQIAVVCRTVVALIGFGWYFSGWILSGQEVRAWTIAGFVLVIAIGMAHVLVIGTRVDQWWMKYLLYGFDALAMCALFVLIPVSPAEPVPQIVAFRAYGIHYFFPLLVLASLCLSWKLVLWTGVMIVAGWWAAFYWIVAGMEHTLSWSDIPANATRSDYETTFLSIDFIGTGNRLEETGLLLASAAILAIVVYRARSVFFAQIRSDAMHQHERNERLRVTTTFGQFVPEVVLDQLVESGGKIPPQQSHGVVLSLDIEGFTAYSANKTPDTIIRKLDDFLSDTADQISLNQGVVISYLGDGLLASFNAPLKVANAEHCAIKASFAVTETAKRHGFVVRLGLAAGDLVYGSVGSHNRMAFTIYGTTVNRAARLESLGKELGHRLLLDEDVADAISTSYEVNCVGNFKLRGYSLDERVYSILPVIQEVSDTS